MKLWPVHVYLCLCVCVSSHIVQVAWGGIPSSFHFKTDTSSLRWMTARFYGWLDYVRKHCRVLIVGKPRLRRIIIPFAPPLFSLCVCVGVWGEWEEDGGKGAICVGWDDAANTRARWDRTSKQLRVTVITQAKLPSMVYVHVCMCVNVACMWICVCTCVVSHMLNLD